MEAERVWRSGLQAAVKGCHQVQGGLVMNRPEAGQKGASAGSQDGSRQSEQLLSGRQLAPAGVAGRQRYEGGILNKLLEIAHAEPAIRELERREARIVDPK